MRKPQIRLAQINTTVGDIEGNKMKIIGQVEKAVDMGTDILVSELTITGYPPEDLLFKPHFIKKNLSINEIASHIPETLVAVVGFVDEEGDIYNSKEGSP